MPEYVLNPALEVTPQGRGTFRLRLPLWGRSTEATEYQVNLLASFHDGSTVEAVLKAFPFNKESSEEFLGRCVTEQVLLERDAHGDPIYPARVWPPQTVFGAPRFDPGEPPAFAVLGVPYDGGTTGLGGARFGPASVRQASQAVRYRVDRLRFEPEGFFDYAAGRTLLRGIRLADAGDVAVWAGDDPDLLFARITDAVKELLAAGTVPLVVGGDHSITHAVLRAHGGRRLGVVHLDAHTDLGSQPGGQLHHGTVFDHVLRDMDHVEALHQLGLRGLGEATAGEGRDPRVFQVGMDALRSHGVAWVLDRLPPELDYHLSLDIDVVDPSFAPATGTPLPGGLFPHELKELVRALASQRSFLGMDLVEVAGAQTAQDGTASLALEALLCFADGAVEFIRRQVTAEPPERREGST